MHIAIQDALNLQLAFEIAAAPYHILLQYLRVKKSTVIAINVSILFQ